MGNVHKRGVPDELPNMDNPSAVQGMAAIAVTYCSVSTYGGAAPFFST